MFALPFRRPAPRPLAAGRVVLRPPVAGDYNAWLELRETSRAFLKPWEPSWPVDELSRANWRARLRRYADERAGGTAFAFFVFCDGELVGGVSLGNIRRGVAQSAQLGYWMGEPHAGKGLMLDALGALLPHAFSTLELHRIEAACIPDNTRSIRLLEKAGFEREGLMRSYLKIDGRWRDHLLYARLADGVDNLGQDTLI